jgi:hypothetical protein
MNSAEQHGDRSGRDPLAHLPYDREADAAHLAIEHRVLAGSAVENVVVERPGRGDIVLDFDADGA